MENHGNPIPRKKKGVKATTKKRNIKSAKVDAVEKGHTYGNDSLNLADTEHAENESVQGEENMNGHESK